MDNHPRHPKYYTDLNIEVSAEDKAAWMAVVKDQNLTVDEWVNQVLNRAVEHSRKKS